jgi:DNA-binding MarR family transcriptional regulator
MSAAARNADRNNAAGSDRQARPASDVDATADLFTTLARNGLFLDALQRECLGEHDLAFTEYSVLRLLQRAAGHHLAPSRLAEEVVCTTGAMTKVVDRLERAGLVTRSPDPGDRRRVLVRLTRNGDRRANAAAATYRAGRERVLARFPEREARGIARSLDRLLEALETDRNEREA